MKTRWSFRPTSLALCALATLVAPQLVRAEERLAVLEFTGAQANPELLRALTDRARGAALAPARERGITVMTREAIALVLKEMGAACAEGECEIEAARSVGASLVVTGDVRKLSDTWLLDLKLHETRKGSLLSVESLGAKSDVELVEATGAATQRLLGGVGGGALDTTAALRIDVDRPGALVAVDGGAVGTSPIVGPVRVEAGKRTLTVQAEGFLPYQTTLVLKAGAEVSLAVRLVPVAAASRPAGPWYAELHVMLGKTSGFDTAGVDPCSDSWKWCGTVWPTARAGRRLGERFAIEAALGWTSLSFANKTDMAFLSSKGPSFGAAVTWSVPGASWILLAAEAGAWSATTKADFDTSSATRSALRAYGTAELRLDLFPEDDWVWGFRAAYTRVGPDAKFEATGISHATAAPFTVAHSGAGFGYAAAGWSLRYRF